MNRLNTSHPSPVTGSRRASGSPKPVAETPQTIADRVRGILSTRNFTLYRVAALAKSMYPRQSAFHIPHNFYFQLRSRTWRPTLHQLIALSRLSNYSLTDWLAVFGFSLETIPRFQSASPYARTTLLDSSVYDQHEAIGWFKDRLGHAEVPAVCPLSQLLEPTGERPLSSLVSRERATYFYAKIGRQDAFAFPDLLPGSIVRANPRLIDQFSGTPSGKVSRRIFLIEHSRGFCCSRLHFESGNRVTLTATQLPFASVVLKLGSEARILGVVDMELRPLPAQTQTIPASCSLPEVAPSLARLWKPGVLTQRGGPETATRVLIETRLHAGLSLHQASELSRAIANSLGETRYFASPGWLSDFEARRSVPRHLHKLLTVCVLYGIRFGELLGSFGVVQGHLPATAIPEQWMKRGTSSAKQGELVR